MRLHVSLFLKKRITSKKTQESISSQKNEKKIACWYLNSLKRLFQNSLCLKIVLCVCVCFYKQECELLALNSERKNRTTKKYQ